MCHNSCKNHSWFRGNFLCLFSPCWDLNLCLNAFLLDIVMKKFHPVSVPFPLVSASFWLIQIMALNYSNMHYNINSASIMIIKFML